MSCRFYFFYLMLSIADRRGESGRVGEWESRGAGDGKLCEADNHLNREKLQKQDISSVSCRRRRLKPRINCLLCQQICLFFHQQNILYTQDQYHQEISMIPIMNFLESICSSCFIYFVLQLPQHEDEQPVQPEPDELTNLLDPPSPFVLNPKTEYFF